MIRYDLKYILDLVVMILNKKMSSNVLLSTYQLGAVFEIDIFSLRIILIKIYLNVILNV